MVSRLFKSPQLPSRDVSLNNWLERLRQKWGEIPADASTRLHSHDLETLPDDELLKRWQISYNDCTLDQGYSIRGWYYTLYNDAFRGKRVLDVGAGFGHDTITFAKAGANVTSLDIVLPNSRVVQRLCKLMGVENVEFFNFMSLESLNSLRSDFDVIWCCGSLINLPFDEVRTEAQELVKHLKPEGRWIELGYPRERWLREGKMPFETWGFKTDGGAPWMEWYDLPKLRARLDPAVFDTILAFNFHNDDFNWFDLVKKN